MRRADRLLKIVHFLRGRRQAVTAAQIGEAFEICTRTVYRDIQDLILSGAPIIGEAGVGYMIDKNYYLPPVTFDAEEIEALALGISMVRRWTDAPFAAKADSAFAKIEAVLPAALQGELSQITTFSSKAAAPVPWTVSFSQLRDCIRSRRRITFDYTDDRGAATTRTARPLAMVFFSPVWLLCAWCETRADFRHFRLDRMQTLKTQTDDIFPEEPDMNFAAFQAIDGVW